MRLPPRFCTVRSNHLRKRVRAVDPGAAGGAVRGMFTPPIGLLLASLLPLQAAGTAPARPRAGDHDWDLASGAMLTRFCVAGNWWPGYEGDRAGFRLRLPVATAARGDETGPNRATVRGCSSTTCATAAGAAPGLSRPADVPAPRRPARAQRHPGAAVAPARGAGDGWSRGVPGGCLMARVGKAFASPARS